MAQPDSHNTSAHKLLSAILSKGLNLCSAMPQVASLQSQVTGLQQTAFTQQAQLERLNQEALALNHASAQEQAGAWQTMQATEGNLQHAEQTR